MEILTFHGKQAIIKNRGKVTENIGKFVESEFFGQVLTKFTDFLREKDSPLLEPFPKKEKSEQDKDLSKLMRLLVDKKREEVAEENPDLKDYFQNTYLLLQFVEQFYNFWREFERFFILYSKDGEEAAHEKPYRAFNDTISQLNHLVRKIYRDIAENITYEHPTIYRQVPAGCKVGLIVKEKEWNIPKNVPEGIKEIPFITQLLIEPPMIIDPPMNKRRGQFRKVDDNPLEKVKINKEEWLCYPAKVGDLVIHIFFNIKFIGLGTALANLFELATKEDLGKKPDAVYFYGVDKEALEKYGDLPTVFYEDKEQDIFFAAVPGDDEFGYFGYIKKMVLTLHNSIIMKRGGMPVHGAMVQISLKNGKTARVVLMGDSGAGKSESLEAFRILSKDHLRDMIIIFDDMGSLRIVDGKIKAYGTETGAFVRLDDLQPGFAFGNLDRSIIMSPQKINARAVLPITTLEEVQRGYDVDFFLYANNYEEVDETKSFLEIFDDAKVAFDVFKKGARFAKGTTAEKGLVETYFANIFGPVQYEELHEKIAEEFFQKLFEEKVVVGQLRTRLGIEGFETKGPETAAEALFEYINKNT